MTNLEELIFNEESYENYLTLNDSAMAESMPSLAACTKMRKLVLKELNMSSNSCAALSVIFPRMTNLLELNLVGNPIDDDCVEVLVRGLAKCEHLNKLDLSDNRIGDGGLSALIEGLPASVSDLSLYANQIALARQLLLLRFQILGLANNFSSSPAGAQVIAASLANPKCLLEQISLYGCNIGDEGATILAASLRGNRRLFCMRLANRDITETGWNAFLPILCDTTSIDATHSSNHTLEYLGADLEDYHLDVDFMLRLNNDENKSAIAAKKILLVHGHLAMKPLFHSGLNLLPYVVRGSRTSLCLCSTSSCHRFLSLCVRCPWR